MKAKYDDITVTVSRAFIAALRDLMQAEMNMMRRAEPRNAECWTWGKCTIRDLASARGLEFEFGGDDDMPPDVTPRRRLVVVAANTRLDDTAAAIAALRAQLAEAQRDSERLDWMIEQCAYVVSDPDCCDGYWLNYPRKDGTMWTQATEHETPRAAIDAAKGESNGTVRAERSGFDTLPDDYKTGDY